MGQCHEGRGWSSGRKGMDGTGVVRTHSERIKVFLGDAGPVVINRITSCGAMDNIGKEDMNDVFGTIWDSNAVGSVIRIQVGEAFDGLHLDGNQGKDIINTIFEKGRLEWGTIITFQNIIKNMVKCSLALWMCQNHGPSVGGAVGSIELE
jgi:hypothetical protein